MSSGFITLGVINEHTVTQVFSSSRNEYACWHQWNRKYYCHENWYTHENGRTSRFSAIGLVLCSQPDLKYHDLLVNTNKWRDLSQEGYTSYIRRKAIHFLKSSFNKLEDHLLLKSKNPKKSNWFFGVLLVMISF